MTSNNYKLLSLLLFLFTASCHIKESSDCHRSLYFKNETSEFKYILMTEKRVSDEDCILFSEYGLEPGAKEDILGTNNNCLETRINNIFNGGIILYIFNEDPNITECDLILSNPNLISTEEYTVEDLNTIDWTINYSN